MANSGAEHRKAAVAAASYPVSHIEWEVADGEKSAAFLSQLLGWEFQRFSDHYWLFEPQVGVAIGLLEKPQPALVENSCPVFVDVPNINDCLAEAARLGAEIVERKTAIPDYGAWAKVKEPGGNTVGLFESLAVS